MAQSTANAASRAAPLPRAIAFDLDGTLVESAPDLHLVLEELMAEEALAAPSLSSLRTMIGDGAKALIARAFAAAEVDLEPARLNRLYARFLDRYTEEPARASTVYPGVVAVLESLTARGMRLGVCTNKPQRPTERLLEALSLDRFFAHVVGGDALAVRKPDPGHLRAALGADAADPATTLMVGDSRNDLLAARAFGARCVLVTYGYTAVPATELGADAVIDSFAELPAALALTPTTAPRT